MNMNFVKLLKEASLLFILLSILTGLIYPLIITGLAQVLFPQQANGSLIRENNKIVGSQLIGQNFTQASYFWGRASSTTPFPYNAAASSGSNLALTNPDFLTQVKQRLTTLQQSGLRSNNLVPVDLVTASGSGLDPEISPLAAFYQVPRVAKVRGLPEVQVKDLVQKNIINRQWGVLGEPRVNVLQLNLALDKLNRH